MQDPNHSSLIMQDEQDREQHWHQEQPQEQSIEQSFIDNKCVISINQEEQLYLENEQRIEEVIEEVEEQDEDNIHVESHITSTSLEEKEYILQEEKK